MEEKLFGMCQGRVLFWVKYKEDGGKELSKVDPKDFRDFELGVMNEITVAERMRLS